LDAYEAHWYLHKNGKLITAESLKNKMLGKSEKLYMLIELFKDHNSKVATLVGKGFAPATHKRYGTSLLHTQAFLKFQFGVADINIEKVDNAFITDYDYYLRTTNKYNNNCNYSVPKKSDFVYFLNNRKVMHNYLAGFKKSVFNAHFQGKICDNC
jgi:hypothetical protein